MKNALLEDIHKTHKRPPGDDYKLRNNKSASCGGCGAMIGSNPAAINERCGSSWVFDGRLKSPCKAAKGQP